MDPADVCTICHQPVLDGQARYGVNDNHYDCEFPRGRAAFDQEGRDAVAKFDRALAELGIAPKKARKPEGQGATALRCQALAAQALTQAVGKPCTVSKIWNQQGAYRGKLWDLDRWGVNFQYESDDGRVCEGHASSLATMTESARRGALDARSTDVFNVFELSPAICREGEAAR